MYVSPGSLPSCGLPATSVAPLFRCSDQSDAVAVPPLSVMTCLTTFTVGAMSSFVIVQTLS